MMRMALELAKHNPSYEDLATKFFEHFLDIAHAMHGLGVAGSEGLWDERDAFYFDVLRAPGQAPTPLRVRSIVGLLPLIAAEVIPSEAFERFPQFRARADWFIEHRPELARLVSNWRTPNAHGDRLLGIMRRRRLNAVLTRMLDETEFLSPYGVRSVSRYHLDHPFEIELGGRNFTLKYEPGEGLTRLYGGNSNWRGPVWAPINFLFIRALRKLHRFYGDEFQMECPTGSKTFMSLSQVSDELSRRVQSLFLKDASGRRPYQAEWPRFDDDPHFRDLLHFFEYFDGDTGRGCGAAHQTGWTGLVAALIRGPGKDAKTRSSIEH